MTSRLGTTTALALALAITAAAPPAWAALATAVADAADKDDPLDVNFDFRWSRSQKKAKILREYFSPRDSAMLDVTEGHYTRIQHVLDMDVSIGLYHDLEIHGRIPFAASDEQFWGYAHPDGVSTESTSTITHNRLNADGLCARPGESLPCSTAFPLMTIPRSVFRGGFMDPSIGIAWGIFNDEREERLSKKVFPHKVRTAAWTVGFDYTMPIIAIQDPFKATTSYFESSAPGALGTGSHRFDWWMAMSKRLGMVEPYMRLHYTLPVASDKAFDNCVRAVDDKDDLRMPRISKEGCKDPFWNQDGRTTGLQMPHVGGLLLGVELIPVEDDTDLRLSVGLQAKADYVSKGRWNSELSDALGRLTWTDQYFVLDGRVTFDLRVSKFVHFVAFLGLGTDTPHAITSETVGKDRVGENGSPVPDGQVSLNTTERNPNYDARVDQVGRRIKLTNIANFTTSFALDVNF